MRFVCESFGRLGSTPQPTRAPVRPFDARAPGERNPPQRWHYVPASRSRRPRLANGPARRGAKPMKGRGYGALDLRVAAAPRVHAPSPRFLDPPELAEQRLAVRDTARGLVERLRGEHERGLRHEE